jgi:ketosteroid isomerase-like protein
MAVEKEGWEAWKDKDAKKLDEITTKDVSFMDPAGNLYPDKSSTLKAWAEPCTVTSVDVTEPHSVSLTTDVGFLTYKGTAAGTCGDQKLSPLWGLSVFIRENGNWKIAFMNEVLASS